MKTFPQRSETRCGGPFLPLLFNRLLEVLDRAIRQEKEIKVIWIIKEKSNTIFADDIYAAAAKSLQSCPTLCDSIDGSQPGCPIPGILQARTLEWVAISFSNAWKWKVKVKSLSRVQFFATPWTAAYQAPPPMGFSRQEYRSGVPLPSPRWYIYKTLKTPPKRCLNKQPVSFRT